MKSAIDTNYISCWQHGAVSASTHRKHKFVLASNWCLIVKLTFVLGVWLWNVCRKGKVVRRLSQIGTIGESSKYVVVTPTGKEVNKTVDEVDIVGKIFFTSEKYLSFGCAILNAFCILVRCWRCQGSEGYATGQWHVFISFLKSKNWNYIIEKINLCRIHNLLVRQQF